jgi:hypothetical protein
MEISWNTAYYWRQLDYSLVQLFTVLKIKKSNLGIAFASACLLVVLDILIEPVAIQYNFELEWNHSSYQNYIAWFIISFIFCYAIAYYKGESKNNLAPYLLILQFMFLESSILWYGNSFFIFWQLLPLSFMEFMAWFTHKFIMHGIMWYFHKDHHHEPGFFEKTTFFLILLFKLVMYNVGTYECILFCSLYRDWHCCLWSFIFFDARRFYTPTL